jgi:hypothetical protein
MKMNIELKPFNTPNFVIQKVAAGKRQDGFTEAPKYSLCEIPAETLDELCNEFRAEIFKKAKKKDPSNG